MWSVPDWRTDEMYTMLDNREQGIYRNLLDECWVSGSITSDPEILARFSREPLDYFAGVWAKIRHKFRSIENGTKLISKRQEQDRRRLKNIRENRKKVASLGGKALANKRKRDKEISAESTFSALPKAVLKSAQTQTQNTEEEESIPSLPDLSKSSKSSVRSTGGNGRTDGLLKTDLQKFWAPVEGFIRKQVVEEAFQELYAGTRIIGLNANFVELAVPQALIDRSGGKDREAAEQLTQKIIESQTGLLRGRMLKLISIEKLIERELS
jgi:uncharacterized protein YdaU (DUF1376 family)